MSYHLGWLPVQYILDLNPRLSLDSLGRLKEYMFLYTIVHITVEYFQMYEYGQFTILSTNVKKYCILRLLYYLLTTIKNINF